MLNPYYIVIQNFLCAMFLPPPKEAMFLAVFVSSLVLCLSVCSRITYKVINIFAWNFRQIQYTLTAKVDCVALRGGDYPLYAFRTSNIMIIKLPNLFEPEFIIVVFIHDKPRIAVAILDL